MAIGAGGDLDSAAVGFGEFLVLKRRVAVSAGCVDGHVAFGAGIGSHERSPFFQRINEKWLVGDVSMLPRRNDQ